MEWNIESIIFYILLLDAAGACWMAWTGKQHWWLTHLGGMSQQFPITRGWTSYYLILVLLLGWIMGRHDILVPLF